MIDIFTISGDKLFSVPILEDAVARQELMAADYVRLSWASAEGMTLPAGCYIVYDEERYSLLDPYTPERVSEVEYRYRPQFHARTEIWDKQPACIYTYEEDGVTLKSREFDWTFTGSPADAMFIVIQAIKNETGEEWTARIADSLPATVEIAAQAASIKSVLSSIAEQCETEYWMDKKQNVLHLSKCEWGETVELSVGENIRIPSVTSNDEGYYTRFYALGSTRNVKQDTSINASGIVNKRLTLDPQKYPYGYKDVKGHFEDGVFVSDLAEGEVFSKTVIFDDIYPSSDLVIADVRPRLKYRLEAGKKVVVGGTDEAPVYEQYAIWYFKIPNFEFKKEMIIEGQPLSVHFKTNQLAGRDFELQYHDSDRLESNDDDVSPFTVNTGDYEILFEEQNGMIIPGLAYIIPQDGDEVILFNIEMPIEYTESARVDLEEALDKHMAEQESDRNTYEFDSDAEAFHRGGLNVSLGQKVKYVNGDGALDTRVLMVEKHLDFTCVQRIRVGNSIIKGRSQELREEVNSLNQNVNVLSAFNDLSKSIQDNYNRTQAKLNAALAAYGEMFYWEEKGVTIGTKYNFFSEGQNAAGGIGEQEGESGGSTATIVVDTAMSDTSDNAVANKVIKAYVDSADEEIEQRLLALEESGTGGGGTVEITKEAIIDALEYTPANENDIPTRVGQLANDMGYLVNAPGDPYATIQNVRNLLSYYVRAEEMDTAMSDTSTNAVQNKAIKAYVDDAINDIDLPQSSEYITVKEGVVSLDVDSQGGLGNTGQGLGIVNIPTSIMTGIEQYVEEETEELADDIKANPKTYIQLKTINGMEIYGEGNIAIEGGSSEGTSGLTAINVNDESFQPDPTNGIVTLPDYRPLDKYNQDLAKKVDKVDGKGLSTNDYTTADKNKLAGIAAGAEVNVQSDWNATSGDAFIKNKPTLSVVATSGSYNDLTNTPRFAPVATSGSYNDLSDKPTIPVEVTETTVAGWGFTKNTGTYIKPSTGIPKSHLASGVQTSLGLADTALQPSALNDYPTTTEVRNALMEALEKYALAKDLTAVDERLADVEAFFDSKDDTDSLVNKWHEIVNFLDATEGDTLDSILSTYATGADLESAVQRITANEATINTHTSQISNHATRLSVVETKATNNATAITNIQKLFTDGKANKAIADGNGNNIVSTYATKTALAATDANVTVNATAISTLQGYFTNGKANNADKLDGYDSSYFATAANLNSLASRVSTAEGEIDDLQEDNATFMAWYNSVGKYFKYDSVNEAWYLDGDFYTTGQNAAGGAGEEDGGGSGIILDYDSIVFALGYVPLRSSDLTPYLTKTAASTTYATINTVTALTNRVSTLEGKATAVSFSQTLTSGKEIGRLTIDGSTKTLYAPSTYTFSELASKPTTLSGYGITDAIYWVNNMDDPDTTYYRHAGYGYPAGGWNSAGPAIAFGANTSYYAQIQAGNDTNTPYMFFRPTSNGVTGETWFRFLFDVGNSNIDSERFSCRGDLVLHRNTADGSTFVNHGPYTNDSAALNLYGRVINLITTDGVLIGGSKVLTESSGDGRYFPLAGNRTITGSVTIESGLTVTGSASIAGGLSKIPQIYGPFVESAEGAYAKWCLFYQTGNDTMYIQAGKNSGTSTDPRKGSIAFSGYGGKNATRVDFSADATYFNGSMSCGALTAKSTTINGTLAVNNHTDISSSMAVDAWLTVGTTLTVSGATSLNSSLTVSGQATLSGGAFLPPSKTIRFQDAATETFSISFDSEVGGLNLSGATRTLGLASFQQGIQIEHGQSIAFVDKDGVKQYITLDEENGAIKVIGNFFATGQNAAGGAGGEELGMLTSWENIPTNLEGMTLSASLGIDLYNNSKKVLTSWEDIPEEGDEGYEDFVLSEYTVSADLVQTMNDKITELSGKTIPESVAIKLTNMCAAFATGSTLTYSNVSSYGLALTQIYGLRDGIYTKVIDDTSALYNKVWEYGAEYSSSGYTFYFRMGDKTITLKSTGTLASSSYTITHNL